MISRRVAIGALIACLLVAGLGLATYVGQRIERCAYVPFLAENLLPNPGLVPGADPGMPAGWERAAGGVQLRGPALDGQGFDLNGDGRAVQLIGIANYLQTPPVSVQPGAGYCFTGYALSDSILASPTRLQVRVRWYDAAGALLSEQAGLWQPVVLWRAEAPPAGWSPIRADFRAPPSAARLVVRLAPSSDDRLYLDLMAVRAGGSADQAFQPARPTTAAPGAEPAPALSLSPWPAGRRAAVAFSFDWETTMGGLIHSRSLDDPNVDQEPLERGLRMREGITTTLALFQPYGVRATYFATGYNFLFGNTEQRRFLDDPTFAWANKANRWTSDRWTTTPWFADDPYGTVASHPAWYFGDLLAPLRAAGHEIQSHSFSHFYGGLVDAATWRADLETWNRVAAEQGVAPARAIAFPWSSSAGMSDAAWMTLQTAGIRAVTRLSDQAQYNLFPTDEQGLVREPRCRPWPGHEAILACPDFYLTERNAEQAIVQINRAIEQGGMIDLWAHTEEVVTPDQLAAWQRVVSYAAENPQVWVAPFGEIAAWQQALAALRIEPGAAGNEGDSTARLFTLHNEGNQDLAGLTLQISPGTARIALNGDQLAPESWPQSLLVIDLAAGHTVEVTLWPTR